jgi:hypothetical protein
MVRVKGVILANTNASAVLDNQPMQVALFSLSDKDSLEVSYHTDNGAERRPWGIVLRDSAGVFLGSCLNKIDPRWASKDPAFRNNSVFFNIHFLRSLLSSHPAVYLTISPEFENQLEQEGYKGNPICIIRR